MCNDNTLDVFKSDSIYDYKKTLDLVVKLSRDTRFSKSEMSVFLFCFEEYKKTYDVEKFLNWKPANTGRVLLAMYNKGMILRVVDEASYNQKGFLYISNKDYLKI